MSESNVIKEKINWLGLYQTEIGWEIDKRYNEMAKLEAEIAVYKKVKDELEKVTVKINKDKG